MLERKNKQAARSWLWMAGICARAVYQTLLIRAGQLCQAHHIGLNFLFGLLAGFRRGNPHQGKSRDQSQENQPNNPQAQTGHPGTKKVEDLGGNFL